MRIKTNISELLFFSALFFYITGTFFKQTQLAMKDDLLFNILTICVLLANIILMVKILLNFNYSVHKLFISILIALIAITIAFISNISLPITLILFCVNVSDMSFDKIIRFSFVILISYVMLIHAIYLLGFLQENNVLRIDGGIRYAIGYDFVTFSSNHVFHLLVMYFYIKKEKIKWIQILCCLIVALYVYSYTDTKSALLYSILIIGCMVCIKIFKNNIMSIEKLLIIIGRYSVMIGAIIPILLSYIYVDSNSILVNLNRILTDRLNLGNLALKNFPIELFGQRIQWTFYGDSTGVYKDGIAYDYLYVDSSFLNILLTYGVVALILIVFGYYFLFNKKQFRNVYFAISLIIITLHAMFDPQFLEIKHNPFIICLGYLITPIINSVTTNVVDS